MLGTKARLFTPLPAVTLEQLVPADHFYRYVDRVLDLSFAGQFEGELLERAEAMLARTLDST